MKITRFFLLGAIIILVGCSGPNAPFRETLSGYYHVNGEVGRPGLVKCGNSEKTLLTVIKDAGGFTIESSLKKIRVSCAGTTNYFDGRKILNQEVADPLLPCGSRIYVTDNLF